MYPLICTPNICIPIHITFFSLHFFPVAGDPNKPYTHLQYKSKTKLVFSFLLTPKGLKRWTHNTGVKERKMNFNSLLASCIGDPKIPQMLLKQDLILCIFLYLLEWWQPVQANYCFLSHNRLGWLSFSWLKI